MLKRLVVLQYLACVIHFNFSFVIHNSISKEGNRISSLNSDFRASKRQIFQSRYYSLNANKESYEYNADSENYLMHLFEQKRPSVVYIGGYIQPFNAWLFDLELMSISQSGSGFIWDDRHIVTNYHVVRDINPSNIYITILSSVSIASSQQALSNTSSSDNLNTGTNENNKQIVRKTMKVSLHGYDIDRDIAVLRVMSDPDSSISSSKAVSGNTDARVTNSVATYLKTIEKDLDEKTISSNSNSNSSKKIKDDEGSKFKLPPPLTIGDSSRLRVGQSVVAIGNPFGLDQTLTTGIISGLNRRVGTTGGTDRNIPSPGTIFQKPKTPAMLYNLIQTDAAINPGNSGGPLLELKSGEVIGMNTALISTSGAFAGIGLAIPIDTIRVVVDILIRGTGGKLRTAESGIDYATGLQAKLFGISQGLVVLKVQKNSPADYAGIRGIAVDMNTGVAVLGDVIKKVNEVNVNSEADFLSAIDKASINGEIVELTVLRNIERSAVAIQMEPLSPIKQQQQLQTSSSSSSWQQLTPTPVMKEVKLKLKLMFN